MVFPSQTSSSPPESSSVAMERRSMNFFGISRRMVGAGRFERPTPCAQGRCATRLRYAPTFAALLILDHFCPSHPFRPPDSQPKPSQNPFTEPGPYQNPSLRLLGG